jgi:hypothetical protein
MVFEAHVSSGSNELTGFKMVGDRKGSVVRIFVSVFCYGLVTIVKEK